MTAKHVLARVRAPGEAAATERAWAVVRTAYPEIVPAPRRRPQRRLAQAAVIASAVAVLVLSSAVASVRLFTPKPRTVIQRVQVSSLPAAGSLLLSGAAGTFTMAAGGLTRRLGSYGQATWSPHGEYIAVAGRDQLRALDPRGRTMWTLRRPQVSDPRWYGSNGYRVAYLSGAQLRVVAGDGLDDHAVAAGAAHVAPAWRPNHPYQLAYISAGSRLVIQDADSLKTLGETGAPRGVKKLAWSTDGARLLAVTPEKAVIYGPRANEQARYPGAITDAALSPNGRTLALIRGSDVVLEPVAGGQARRVLSEAGLRQIEFSPDGNWLLVSWPAADEWLFVRVSGPPRILALPHIHESFQGFPQLDGWCCNVVGTS